MKIWRYHGAMADEPTSQTTALIHMPREKPPWLEDPLRYTYDTFTNLCAKIGSGTAPVEFQNRFSDLEKESMLSIFKGVRVDPQKMFQMWTTIYLPGHEPEDQAEPKHIGYKLDVAESIVKCHPRALPHFLAHELKHASIIYGHYTGHANTLTHRHLAEKYRVSLYNKHQKLEQEAQDIETDRHFKNTWQSNLVSSVLICTNNLKKAANLVGRMFVIAVEARIIYTEERRCDDFAVRATPEVDIDDVETYFNDFAVRVWHAENDYPETEPTYVALPEARTNRLVSFFQDNFCRTHPTVDERLATMRKKQREILKNG